MKQKKIGLLTTYDRETDRLFLKRPYFDFANLFGEVILLTHFNSVVEDLDLLILPGGADVLPTKYNQAPEWLTQRPDIFREYFDESILPQYMALHTPIFGICRGHQSFAVSQGLELIQHSNIEVDSYSVNETSEEIVTSPYARKLLGVPEKIKINSLHHQIVASRNIDESKVDIAALTSKGYIEALIYKNYPAITCQWHPELIFDSFALKAVKYLLNKNK